MVLAWDLAESATSALVERCRREQVTVDSALWTAFLAAQYRVQGDSEAFRSQAGMAVSTRDGLSVPVGDALGFYASSLTAELKHDPRASFWDGARTCSGASPVHEYKTQRKETRRAHSQSSPSTVISLCLYVLKAFLPDAVKR